MGYKYTAKQADIKAPAILVILARYGSVRDHKKPSQGDAQIE
jgi:hypothetical protein